MRPAEVLAEMLLNEAKIFGVIFGPDLPETGNWVAAENVRQLAAKLARGLGAGENQQTAAFLNKIVSHGYSLIVSAGGKIVVYGLEIPELTSRTAKLLNLSGSTPVEHSKQFGVAGKVMTAKDAFGVSLTPEEKEKLKRERAAERAERQAHWGNVDPAEYAEYVSRNVRATTPTGPGRLASEPSAAGAEGPRRKRKWTSSVQHPKEKPLTYVIPPPRIPGQRWQNFKNKLSQFFPGKRP